jgi:hypothetical protein
MHIIKKQIGVITFSPHELPTRPKEHSTTKDNYFPPFRQLKGLKETVNGSCAVLHGACWKIVIVHGGKEEDGGSS